MANSTPTTVRKWRLPAWIALCAFLAIAAFYLWTDHRTHLLGVLPYALLLLCPLLHLFMHRGHDDHRRGDGASDHAECHGHGKEGGVP